MIVEYLPILVFIVFALIFGVAALVVGFLLSPKAGNKEKLSQYECGFNPFQNSRLKFDIRFYLVAILFIIFDLEIAFLFPFAVVTDSVGIQAFIAMGIFLGLLVVGFIYEWMKGALEWE